MELLEGTDSRPDQILPTPQDVAAEPAAEESVTEISQQPEAAAEVPQSEDVASVTTEEVLDKDGVVAALTALASLPDDQIDPEEAARLKRVYYTLDQTDERAAYQDYLATGASVEDYIAPLDERTDVVKQLLAQIKEKKALQRQRLNEQLQANAERKRSIIAEIEAMAADTDNVNRHWQRAKDLQAEFKTIGEVPQEDTTSIWKNFATAVEKFYDQWKVNKELRDYDFKKNLGEKQLIISEAQSLVDEPDPITAFRRLQDLHQKWRETGPVAKELRDQIWDTFRDVSATISKRYQAFFEERKAQELQAEAEKEAICKEVEALDWASATTFARWNELTAAIIDAQARWKKIGHAPRKANNALYAQFRKTCDQFFEAKANHFRSVKNDLAENLARKIALCEQAEALKESTDWRKTTDELLKLKEEWKTVGPVPKKQSDVIWHRFLEACDYFFDRKKKINSTRRKEESANLKIKRGIVSRLSELLAAAVDAVNADDTISEIQQLRQQWQATGHVPIKEKEALAESYRKTVGELFDKYDIRQTRARISRFEDSVEAAAGTRDGDARLLRDRERLLRTYEQRRAELKTYENNLGFFNSRTKNGDLMMREMERKIQRIKDDIAELENKIAIIDKKI